MIDFFSYFPEFMDGLAIAFYAFVDSSWSFVHNALLRSGAVLGLLDKLVSYEL